LNTTLVLIINFTFDQLVLAKLKAFQNQINILRTQKIIVMVQQKYNMNTMKEKQILKNKHLINLWRLIIYFVGE